MAGRKVDNCPINDYKIIYGFDNLPSAMPVCSFDSADTGEFGQNIERKIYHIYLQSG